MPTFSIENHHIILIEGQLDGTPTYKNTTMRFNTYQEKPTYLQTSYLVPWMQIREKMTTKVSQYSWKVNSLMQ
jgi:hypothetical protein